MPQIWPMNWLVLFLFFILTFLVFLCTFYFNMSLESNSQSPKENCSSRSSLSWKW